MTQGEIDDAVRRALNILEKWNNVTGIFDTHSGYWGEIKGVVEDAVHCGAQAALGINKKLESEKP